MKTNETTNQSDFTRIYRMYFPKMVRFACEYVLFEEEAQNIVQDLFMYLWERRDVLASVSNINAFLFTLTKNRCIDFYRKESRISKMRESLDSIQEKELYLKMESLMQFDEKMLSAQEIELVLEEAINQLPDKCRKVFILSRMEGLKHDEIASQLNISVNTVQNHISAALRKLKVALKDYLPLFIFII